MSAFFFPQGFLTAILQKYSRQFMTPIDLLNFSFEMMMFYDPKQIDDQIEEGCYVHGLYMDGCRWDIEANGLEDSHSGETYAPAPIIVFLPTDSYEQVQNDYSMPVYKTSVRAGVLSTTGHSTNFVIAIDCPSTKKPAYWVLKGAAFLCQLDN